MFRRFLLSATAAVALGLIVPSSVRADFVLELQSGSNTVYVDLNNNNSTFGQVLNNASYTSNGTISSAAIYLAPGSQGYGQGGNYKVNISLVFDGYDINTVTNITNNPGTQSGATLNLQSTSVDNDSGGKNNNLTISLTSTSFSLPTPQGTLTSSFGASSIVANGNYSFITVNEGAYYSSSNAAFGESGQSVTATNGAGYSSISNFSESTALSGSNNSYSMTDVLSMSGLSTVKANSTIIGSGDIDSTVFAPAPSGLILATTMVPFFALLRRRLRGLANPVVA